MKIFVTFSFVVTCCAAQNLYFNQEDYRYKQKFDDEQNADFADTANENIPQSSVDVRNNFGPSEENSATTNEGSCNCAVFSIINPTETTQPISVISAENVTCDENGQKQCLNTCTQLKMERCPAVLCMKIGHAEKFKAISFISVCSKPWIFTGLSSKTEMCCHDFVSIPCNELAKLQYTNNNY